MEEEVQNILREALPDLPETGADLAGSIRRVFPKAAGEEPWEMPELPPDWVGESASACRAIAIRT